MARDHSFRLNLFFVFVLAAAALISYRFFVLAYVRHAVYSKTSQAQNENISNVLVRGGIYLNDPSPGTGQTYLAATNKKFPLAYVVPADLDPDKYDSTAGQLASVLDLDPAGVLATLQSRSKSLRILARRISDDKVAKIKSLNLKSLGTKYEMDRFYPGESLAASVLGFFGNSAQGKSGQYGVEAYYESELSGQTGTSRPADIVLTIDKNIQTFVEHKLEEIIKKWNAAGGTVIVQEPATGRILAMADRPTFNPNAYNSAKPQTYLNRSLQEEFEPGSSFKPVTMAAGLDLNKVSPQTTFTDQGAVTIGGFTIKNFNEKSFGVQTMSQVLEKSINTGAMFVENLIGDENFLNYTINLGFGQKTGIDLPGEITGDITNLYSGRKINYLTAAFGQGIAVTPLQLINAYSAIANGGKLMKPYVVDKIIKEGGGTIETKPEVVTIPISEKTANKLKAMLVSVVDNGFDKARISGYDIAGKTGTAQIPDGRGGYEENVFIHDFVGFAPAYNPKFVILLKMDRPQGIKFAADSLSPAFQEITRYLLNYYNIPPTRK